MYHSSKSGRVEGQIEHDKSMEELKKAVERLKKAEGVLKNNVLIKNMEKLKNEDGVLMDEEGKLKLEVEG
jgi:hypothetical protein